MPIAGAAGGELPVAQRLARTLAHVPIDLARIVAEAALPIESRMAAQAALARLGDYAGKIDGDMGKRSRKALRDWQLSTGRPRDGHLTMEQVRALTA